LSVYLQNRSGGLNFELLFDIPYASHYSPQGLVIGDVNNDGYDDVVIADNNNMEGGIISDPPSFNRL